MVKKKNRSTIIVKSIATTILGYATLGCAYLSAHGAYDFVSNPYGDRFEDQGGLAAFTFLTAILSIGAGIATYDSFKSTMKDIKEYDKINKVKLEDIIGSK